MRRWSLVAAVMVAMVALVACTDPEDGSGAGANNSTGNNGGNNGGNNATNNGGDNNAANNNAANNGGNNGDNNAVNNGGTNSGNNAVNNGGTNNGQNNAANNGSNNAANNGGTNNDPNNGANNDPNNTAACLSMCPEACPAPADQVCASDGVLYCTLCEVECMGLERVPPWMCRPSGEGEATLGTVCGQTAECTPGLECLEVHSNGCNVLATACSAWCQTDEDCDVFSEEGAGRCIDDGCPPARHCARIATSDLGLGSRCTADTQCRQGLTCQPLNAVQNGTCGEFARVCSVECTADAECAAHDPRGACLDDCSGVERCHLTE